MNVELAQDEDLTEIVAFGYASFKENSSGDFGLPVDLDKATFAVAEGILKGSCYVLRDPESGRLDGVFLTHTTSPWYSLSDVVHGLLLYVRPEARSFKNACSLINAVKEYAIINNLPVAVDLYAKKDVKQKGKLLKYLGFEECGSFFLFKPASA